MKLRLKLNKIHEGAKSAFVYTFATLFSRGLAIITVPIFTRIMTTDQIGIVNLYSSWYSLISVVATLSLTSGGLSIALKEFEGERDQYLSSVLSLTSGIGLLIGVTFLVFSDTMRELTGLSGFLLFLMSVGFIVSPARDFWLARQRYEYKYKLAAGMTIFSALAASVLSIVAVKIATSNDLNNHMTIAEYRLIGNYIIVYGVAAVIWVYLFAKGRTLYHPEYWKRSLSLSIPLVGYAIALQILSVSDRLMISRMVGDSAVGIYGTLYSVSSLSLLVWSAINGSFVPYLYQNIGVNDKKIKEISFVLLGVYSLVAVGLVYLAPEVVRILTTEEYYKAIFIMPPIAGGIYYTAASNMYSNVLVYLKKTKYIMYSAVIAAIFNLVTNYIFIRQYGYMAAAYTTLLSYIIMSMYLVYFANKCGRENGVEVSAFYATGKIGIMTVATTLLCLAGLLLYRNSLLRYIVIAVMVLFGGCLVCYLHKKKMMFPGRKSEDMDGANGQD